VGLGEVILWGCNPDRTGRTKSGDPVALRRALLMVTRVVGTGSRCGCCRTGRGGGAPIMMREPTV
jgi:hypothetical protein